MQSFSQNVNNKASADFHNLCEARSAAIWQVAAMSDDKNGGPNYLKAWRGHAGLTQQELADRVHKSVSMINMLEAGERGLTLKWLRMLAPPLGISPGELADRDPEAAGADTPPPALELDVEILARAIADVQPAYVAARDDPDASLNAANAIASVLRSAARSPTIRDDPASWAAVVDVAIDAFFGPKAPRRPSLPNTQRHKSDNS